MTTLLCVKFKFDYNFRLSKQGQRPLSYGKCRFLVLGMSIQFWMLLMIAAMVASILLLMVLIYTRPDEGDANAMEEMLNTFGKFKTLLSQNIMIFGIKQQLQLRVEVTFSSFEPCHQN